ncbi:Methyltransferase domain-containing protein [Mucilaginibacter pineti]|uniref:Methyltransferase domain-containing protein n=1 Tax=Mucilaginibacter pineti TaxID=1391627 RepID=A0A1G6TNA1_9SPHI|nr:methyltransferase domain-containing protein [Mucilaginibacter pineti]SDD29966.1 Methyltransferase domain-containing protein [Mucilaginibacter pineti]
MEPSQEQIREQQKQSWNKFSPGWKKWDTFNMAFLKPFGDAIISALKIKDGDYVLDIATGTGEPGLIIAKLTPNGKVIGTDLSENMLSVALENAETKGIKNYETVAADVSELPFTDATFNTVSCRMGFMFFPDMNLAAKEMYRVLKPGGRIATSVWAGADLNPWVTTIMSIIQKHIELPAPLPGSPGMFRCSKPGFIADIFKQAGFKNTSEKLISVKVDYKSFDRYWEMMLDVAAPIVAAMANADDATKATIKTETEELFLSRNKDGEAILDYAAFVVYGEK